MATFHGRSLRSGLQTYDLTVTDADDGARLDTVVARELPSLLGRPVSKSSTRRLIMAGAVRLAGQPIRRPGFLLAGSSRLRVVVDLERLDRSQPRGPSPAALGETDVLYEDDDLIAVCKPAGLQVHRSADPARDDLVSAVKRLLAARHGRDGSRRAAGSAANARGEPYLGVHQRLDLDTSGCVLFTKTERANAGVAAQFERHAAEKVYHAIVARPAVAQPDRWTSRAGLARVGRGRGARMEAVREGGLEAETSFAVLANMPLALLVEARPKTGRTHQIRAHLAGGGTPILGDARYGAPTSLGGVRVTRIMLHAARLRLAHPVTGVPVAIQCPYPPDFKETLESLEQSAPPIGRARRRPDAGNARTHP